MEMNQRSCKWIISVVIVAISEFCNALPMWQEILKKPELSEFADLVEKANMSELFLGNQVLAFIPDNVAMKKKYPLGTQHLTVEKLSEIVLRHVAKPLPFKGLLQSFERTGEEDMEYPLRDFFLGKFRKCYSLSGHVLYWVHLTNVKSAAERSYYINNAKLINSSYDRMADNGVYHVIAGIVDSLNFLKSFMEYGKMEGPGIVDATSFMKFKITDHDDMVRHAIAAIGAPGEANENRKKFTTAIYAASDRSFRILGTKYEKKRKEDRWKFFREFPFRHFSENQPFFTIWAKHLTFPKHFQMGYSNQTFTAALFEIKPDASHPEILLGVDGVIAKLEEQVVVTDGIVTVMDRPLYPMVESSKDIIKARSPNFYKSCIEHLRCRDYLDMGNVTFIVPLLFEAKSEDSLLTYIMPDFITTFKDFKRSGKSYLSSFSPNRSEEIRFINDAGKILLEIKVRGTHGYSRPTIVFPDVRTNDGVVHFIDLPFSPVRFTIKSILKNYKRFSMISHYLDIHPEIQFDSSTTYTFFAPTNDAIADMKRSYLGKQIFLFEDLRSRLIKGLISPESMDLSLKGAGETVQLSTLLSNDDPNVPKLQLSTSDTMTRISYGSTNVEEVDPEFVWRCSNGLVYLLPKIPFLTAESAEVVRLHMEPL